MTRILITDAPERAALAAARSLVRAGHEVHVAAPRRLSLAAVTRRVSSFVIEPSPLREPGLFACAVGDAAAARSIRLLLPVSDASVEALLDNVDELPRRAALPFPPLPVFRRASDKQEMMLRAAAAGFDVPPTAVIPHPGASLPDDASLFPAVVKPHRSVIALNGPGSARVRLGVSLAENRAAAAAVLERLPLAAYPVLVQRQVGGIGEGLFVLRWNGRIVATFAHRRLREKPHTGGVSVYRESVPVHRQLLAAGTRLLDELDWQGVAMIECRRDPATNRFTFLEINGRLWGSLQLAIDAGVDFPALLVDCATGGHPAGPREYQVGVRSRWFWGDVDNLYLRLRRAQARPTDPGAGNRLVALKDFVRSHPGDRGEIWRWTDPLPFIVETLGRVGLAPGSRSLTYRPR